MKKAFFCVFLFGVSFVCADYEHLRQTSFHEMIRIDQYHLIVDWTPRAGCTCVLKNVFRNLLGMNWSEANIVQLNNGTTIGIHKFTYYYLTQHPVSENVVCDPSYYKIKFVRNPYLRVVSSFVKACTDYGFRQSFTVFLQFLEHPAEYSRYVQHMTQEKYAQTLRHARIQYHWGDRFMDAILKIEECPHNLMEINQRLGIHLDLSAETSPHHTHYMSTCDAFVGDKTPEVWCKKKEWPPYYSFYSQEILEQVQRIYRDDIDHYGYEVPAQIQTFINTAQPIMPLAIMQILSFFEEQNNTMRN